MTDYFGTHKLTDDERDLAIAVTRDPSFEAWKAYNANLKTTGGQTVPLSKWTELSDVVMKIRSKFSSL